MNLLALDLASTCGFALDADDIDTTDNPEYGSMSFDGGPGARALAFENWLTGVVKDRHICTIAIEAAVPVRGTTNLDALLWLRGSELIVRKIAAAHKLKLMIVGVGTWRSFFIGRAHAPKRAPNTGEALDTPAKRRKWLKQATMRECFNLGFHPRSDNESDALAILTYCLACFDPKNGMDPNELYAEAA